MTEKKCDRIRPLLSRNIDGLLNQAEQVTVAAHLKECPDCVSYYKNLLRLHDEAKSFMLEGDNDFWLAQKDKILERIDQAENAKIVPISRKGKLGPIFKWTAVAASVALVAFISIREYRVTHPESVIFDRGARPAAKSIQIEPAAKKPVDTSGQIMAGAAKPSQAPIQEPKIPAKKSGTALTPETTVSLTEEDFIAPAEKAAPAGDQLSDHDKNLQPPDKKAATSPPVKKSEPVQNLKLGQIERPMPTQNAINLAAVPKAEKDAAARAFAPAEEASGYAADGRTSAIDSISKENNLETYAEWRRRLEYLEARYGNVLNGHIYESASKARITETSQRTTLAGFADAYYNIARLTPNPSERTEMIANLQTLLHRSDIVMKILVKNYLGFLQTPNN
ncbi:hypothetical protein TRIP_C60550 [Candidatus Zixiibacteriota bacterium]|nr:hypothetical protein TRIP_C60550 [candidate division Zixibacteria bacterium]